MTNINDHTYEKQRLEYTLNFPQEQETLLPTLATRAREVFFRLRTREDLLDLWEELAVSEALIFYEHVCAEFRLHFKETPGWRPVLKKGIKHYGLSRTIFAVQAALKNAFDYGFKNNYTEDHVQNCVQSNLTRYCLNPDGGRTFDLRAWGRNDKNVPEPTLARTFAENFLPYAVDYCDTPLIEAAAMAYEDVSTGKAVEQACL